MSSSEQLTTIGTSDEVKYQNDKGNIDVIDIKNDLDFIKGFTTTPTDPDGSFLSINRNNIEVTINRNIDKIGQVQYTAHELYLHALFCIEGKDANHFRTINGRQIKNIELKGRVESVEGEAIKNYLGQ